MGFHLIFIISLLFFANSTRINAAEVNHKDSTTRLYIYDIKFEGANVQIDANYQYILESFAEYLNRYPELYVHIRGHVCCRAGKRISRRRARNIYRYMIALGVSKDRMTHAGYSDTLPLVFPERTDDDERRNRRVDFVLSKERIEPK